MRVIAGELGGRTFAAPPGRRTRPTASRIREAWFSALGARVVDARVADLFAGSGALGIEALSRGARHVHLVESDRRTAETTRANLSALDLTDRSELVVADVFRFLDAAGSDGFDLVLADPPYASPDAARLASRFEAVPFAELLCIEHDPRVSLAPDPLWSRAYGDSQLTFLARPAGVERGGQ